MSKKGFTLIELLVVIAIIAMLLAILLPSLGKAKRQVQTVICRSNLKQWALVFTLYAYDNEDSFPQGDRSGPNDPVSQENAWLLGATLQYYQDLNLRMCPSTKPPKAGDTDLPGGTFIDWGPYPDSPNGNEWYDAYATGSYGFNEWCADMPAGADWWGLPHDNAIRKITVKGASNVPLVLDSVFVGTAVDDIDIPPNQNEHDTDKYPRADWDTNAMQYYCIDRHSGGINAAFVDLTARHVGIKELYRLKWHKNFITSSVPSAGWPAWTDRYKDY